MPSRAEDWIRQADRDLGHARDAFTRGTFEWAAFAAQQAAEKAVKGLYQSLGADARGHSVTQLLGQLPVAHRAEDALIERAKELDKHYIGPRYPNSYPGGAPMDFYTQAEAERAIEAAERIIAHCKRHLVR
ncbi:MAG: HEPN domain-containing protein [Candidatus Rokubacteria bacterium]|nr:HEPN domain-containing protein [Candidatus Rokubacteria bacterium]